MPESEIVRGLPAALSVMVTTPERAPAAAGAKVTRIAQLAPAATLVPQVSLLAKSPGLAPPSVRLEMWSCVPPLFVRVTVSGPLVVPTGWLPKAKLVAESETPDGLVPVPESEIVRGLPAALSVMVITPERAPAAAGAKVTRMAQLAPAATLAPQVSLLPKSPGLAPPSVRLEMWSCVPPLFVRVTVSGPLVVPTGWLPKAKLVAESETPAGATPVPESGSLSGLLAALLVTVTLAARGSAALGLNVTLNVQLFPAPRLLAPNEHGEPPAAESAKSDALAPVIVMLLMLSVALPELVSVIVRRPLALPTV